MFYSYHGHECQKGKMDENLREEREKKTAERVKILKKRGFQVTEMYECEFYKLMKEDPLAKSYYDKLTPEFFRKKKWTVSQEKILEAVESGELFGAVEVDISVSIFHTTKICKTKICPYNDRIRICL